MHELGVTFYVVRDVKKVAEENNVKKIDYDKENILYIHINRKPVIIFL